MTQAMRPAYQKYDVSVRPSAIDGQGVFAAEPIAAHRKIGEIRGESLSVEDARIRATRHERIMIVEVSSRRAIDFSKSSDLMRYTNHSCAPNELTRRKGMPRWRHGCNSEISIRFWSGSRR